MKLRFLIRAHQDIPLFAATNAKGLEKGSSNPSDSPEEVPGEENKSALTRWGTAFLLKSAISSCSSCHVI